MSNMHGMQLLGNFLYREMFKELKATFHCLKMFHIWRHEAFILINDVQLKLNFDGFFSF